MKFVGAGFSCLVLVLAIQGKETLPLPLRDRFGIVGRLLLHWNGEGGWVCHSCLTAGRLNLGWELGGRHGE